MSLKADVLGQILIFITEQILNAQWDEMPSGTNFPLEEISRQYNFLVGRIFQGEVFSGRKAFHCLLLLHCLLKIYLS